ncbi:MAG: glycosyltransferase family 4 protein [Verrucomicrobiota bacterium]
MIALSFSFPHHGKYSSYHRLLAYLGESDEVVDASMPKFMYQRLLNPRGYTQRAWRALKERQAWSLAESGRHEWIHYLYPEHGYFRGRELNRRGMRIATSCHLPKDALEAGGERRRALKEGLSISDAMIVMSPDYVDYYQSFAPNARVAFIPHGIDVHYFQPSKIGAGNGEDGVRRILTVGNMLRDFETLAKVVGLAADRGANWRFEVVALQDRLDALQQMVPEKGRNLLGLHCGISNEALLSLYRESDLLYLPLLDATANNAVVEAMACGLPMLLSDFPATRAYAGDTASYQQGRDAGEAYDRIAELVDDREAWLDASEKSRKRAVEELAWEAIAEKHRKFLEA